MTNPKMAIGLLLAGLFSIVVYVGFLNLGPTVTDSTNTFQNDTYIDNYPGASNLVGLGPLLFVVAILVTAALPAIVTMAKMGSMGGRG